MTNPDNIVRVRARTGGRASVYEANGWCQAYTSGLLEGNGVLQNTSADMNVLVGGSASKPDVVLAENPAGYKIALDLVGQQAVAITAPASNSRISAIVAYTDDLSLSTTEDTVTGSPSSCGLIVVNGTAASSPSEPTDTQIRSAITADGATGSQAAYCVIATILVANNTTIITNSEITNKIAGITAKNVDFTTFTYYKMTNSSVTLTNVGNYQYKTITGTDLTIDVKAGEKYILFGNAAIRPTSANEVYLQIAANGTSIGSSVLNSGVSAFTNLTRMIEYTANTTASVTFSLYTGTGGAASTGVTVLTNASIFIMKISN